MKYRTKIITYKNGRQVFIPQVKKWWGWIGISCSGREAFVFYADCETISESEDVIQKHQSGNAKVKHVQVRYYFPKQ